MNILASHRLPGYTVDLIVGGSLNEPSLGLQSEPHMDPSDILALLLFRKPCARSARASRRDLHLPTVDVVSGYAASMLTESVSEALGLFRISVSMCGRLISAAGLSAWHVISLAIRDTRIGV